MTTKAHYQKLVEYYFEQEFSNHSIKETILRTTKVQVKPEEYWDKKVEKVIELYRRTNKNPAEAAAFIASLFKPRLKSLL